MESWHPSEPIATRIQKAVTLHQQGQLDLAEKLYLSILEEQPEHFDALHLLGVIRHHRGYMEEALAYMQKAIRINPLNPSIYLNYANALAANNQAESALTYIDQALSLQPNNADIYYNRGNTLRDLKRFEEALESYHHAIRFNSQFAEAYYNTGHTLFTLERFEDAISPLEHAIRLKPGYVNAHYTLGVVFQHLDRWDEALENYSRAIHYNPDYAEAYYQQAVILEKLKQYDEALTHYDKAISLQPQHAEAYNGRGNIFMEQKKWDESLFCFDQAITLQPDFAYAHYNRGNLLAKIERYTEAIASYTTAIQIRPLFAEAYTNRGNAFKALKQFDETLKNYERAIEIDPNCTDAHWNTSLLQLLLGNYEIGWKQYEWRWKHKVLGFTQLDHRPESSIWKGNASLKGKTILIDTEQGLGDTLQFCRYAPLLKQYGCKVLFEMPKTLIPLLQSLPGIDQFSVKGTATEYDYYTPLLNLPLAFNTTLQSIPANIPYLQAPSEKINQWKRKLGSSNRPRIGLAWSGNPTNALDCTRSIPLAFFSRLLNLDVEFISLQKEIRDSDKNYLKSTPIRHFENHLHDFSDTAALITCLDLIISVDTSIAHLAGALGKPLWILISYMPEWRWLLDREDSPWYPSARLFRQTTYHDWENVLNRVTEAVQTHFSVTTSPSASFLSRLFKRFR